MFSEKNCPTKSLQLLSALKKKPIFNTRQNRTGSKALLTHTIFWVVAFMLRVLVHLYYIDIDKLEPSVILNMANNHIAQMGLVYFHLLFLVPRFLQKRQGLKYLLFILPSMAAAIGLKLLLNKAIGMGYSGHYHEILQFVILSLVYGAILTAMKFFQDGMLRQELEYQLKEAEGEKLSAELKSLKAQIHPHFLFNTLNNIYSLSVSNSKHTSDYILMLSELMSYVLHESVSKFVPVEKELHFIENFIALEKLRLPDNNDVDYTIVNNTEHFKIAPLLMVPLVENAFKHGSKLQNLKFRMNVSISTSGEKSSFEFFCQNAVDDEEAPLAEKSGIGLKNLKQRLKRIYPNQYTLETERTNGMYKVHLSIFPTDEEHKL